MRTPGPLVDSQLLEEIELLADVIAHASVFPGRLSTEEVDSVIGATFASEDHSAPKGADEGHDEVRGSAANGQPPAER